jgi:hypothetical protein
VPRKIDDAVWEAYFTARAEGISATAAARKAGLSKETALRYERTGTGSGLKAAERLGLSRAGKHAIEPKLDKPAKRAIDDFAYFRRRYLGRRTVGWQTDAANQIVKALTDHQETDEEMRLVVNAPPGAGKSTLFTHDIPVWLICRDRSVRIMLGAAAETISAQYARRIRATLARQVPIRASGRDIRRKLAFDAEATLRQDFGQFEPDSSTIWRASEFTVRQTDDTATGEKESTVTAYGKDSEFLGGRFDVVIWDDLVTVRNMRTDAGRKDLFTWWDTQAESRVEPGGVFILQGQRINANDLYRYCLDKRDDDGTPTYRHVVYKAHDDSKCEGHHYKEAAWPATCLLDPRRLPYKKLMSIKESDARLFEVVYQQGDVNPDSSLIDKVWVNGGEDEHGQIWPGCLDTRGFSDAPEILKDGTAWSVITVDPSPTKWWGILWWAYHPATEQRFLIRAERRKMPSNQLLDMDLDTGEFSGLAEEWRKMAVEAGIPLDQVIVERNAAQRFMLQSTIWTRWTSVHLVPILPHDTHINKTDPQYGLSALVGPIKAGRYRLPTGITGHEENVVKRLIHEMTHYPAVEDSDLLMAAWFFEHHLAKTWSPRQSQHQLNTPTYLREVQRGIRTGDKPKPRLRFRLG